jgi:hypothetical protein
MEYKSRPQLRDNGGTSRYKENFAAVFKLKTPQGYKKKEKSDKS